MSNSNLCSKYFESGYPVTPIKKDKTPALLEWQKVETYKDYEKLIDNGLYRKGFGLLTGKPSGIICVDIDTVDPILIKKIEKILPPSPLMKKGNKDRPANRFYKYNGEDKLLFFDEQGVIAVEVLSTGQQTVMPPSMHPNGYKYAWVSEHQLPDFDIDELNIIPPEVYEELSKLLSNKRSSTSNKVGGRNNKLKEVATAKLTEGKSIEQTALEILEYDTEYHEQPLFYDKTEYSNPKALENAFDFTYNHYKFLLKLGKIKPEKQAKFELIDTKSIEKDEYKLKKLPHFRGMARDIFDYIYDNSIIPRTRFSAASVLSLMSIILGNKCQFEGMLPNLFNLIVAPSGAGKDWPIEAINTILSQSGMQEVINSDPASDVAVIGNFPNKRVQIFLIKEASSLFKGMNASTNGNGTVEKLADAMANIFTSSGIYFNGKIRNSDNKDNDGKPYGQCFSPYCAVIASMTFGSFNNSITTALINHGLCARFLYFVDNEEKRKPKRKYKERRKKKKTPKNIINYIKKMKKISDSMPLNVNPCAEFPIHELEISEEAYNFFVECSEKINDELEKFDSDNPYSAILRRKEEHLLKLIIIDTCSVQYKTPINKMEIQKDNIEWAMSFIEAQYSDMYKFINENVSSNEEEKNRQEIHNTINKYRKGIQHTKLYNKLRKLGLKGREMKEKIDYLIEAGLIAKETVTGKAGPKATNYIATKYIKKGE